MFYVYTLNDPRDGNPFYVGKGKGDRAYQHVKDAISGRVSNSRKYQRIKEILDFGLEPAVKILRHFEHEIDALDFEAELIGTLPLLTNIAARGSASPHSVVETKHTFEKRRRTNAYLKKWLAWAKSLPNGITFPSMPNGDAVAAEFLAGIEWALEIEGILKAGGV